VNPNPGARSARVFVLEIHDIIYVMKIIFSDHALVKINQRKISKKLVIKTVKSPDFLRPSYGFREEKYKKFNKNYLKVVIVKENEKITIVTVHWVAKIKIR